MSMAPRLPIQNTIMGLVATAATLTSASPPALAGVLTFSLTTYPAGDFASGIAHGDIDGDGSIDLVIANSGSNTLSVLLNPGDGEPFQQGTNVPVPAGQPRDVALADVDGDGDNDLLVAIRQGSATLLVYRNLGGGDFAAPALYGGSVNAFSLEVADFNRDGRIDVAVAHGFFGASIDVFLNLGEGDFAQPESLLIGDSSVTYIADVAAGDVDGDGAIDLVGVLANTSAVTLMLNSGAGEFAKPVPIDLGEITPTGVALADVDRDGDNDLVLADVASGGLLVARNNGAGAFGDPVALSVPAVSTPFTTPMTPAIGDVNGDGLPDLAVAGRVLLNLGDDDAGFAPPMTVSNQKEEALAGLAGDMNGDGQIDLAFTWFGHPNSVLELFLNAPGLMPGDANSDGAVDVDDLIAVILAWGPCPPPEGGTPCPADVDSSGSVDVDDLLTVILNWTG